MTSKQAGQINYSKITNPINIFSQKVRNLARQLHEVELEIPPDGGVFLRSKTGREVYTDVVFEEFPFSKFPEDTIGKPGRVHELKIILPVTDSPDYVVGPNKSNLFPVNSNVAFICKINIGNIK